jgi:hypothetical protein
MVSLQERLERLVSRLERGKNHRVTLIGLREAREGLKTIHEILVTSDLTKRLERLESHAEPEDEDEDDDSAEAA